MIKNIIFDWSGTLSDDFNLVYQTIMNIFEELGIEKISVEQCRREFRLPYMNFYKKYTDAKKKEIDKLFLKYNNLVGEPNPFPKARDFLNFLNNENKKIVILSAVPQQKLLKEVKNNQFDMYLLKINGGVHDKTGEIEKIIKNNNLRKHETIYVADMVHDIKVGKKAGVKTIAVTWGYQSEKELKKAGPDVIVNDFNELKKVIL